MRAVTMCVAMFALTLATGCGAMMADKAFGYEPDEVTFDRGRTLYGYAGTAKTGSTSGAALFADDDEDGAVSPLDVEPGEPVILAQQGPRKVIYAAEISVEVGDVKDALKRTKLLAEEMGGYMQRMTSDQIVVRVPAAKFDEALGWIEKLGTVDDKDITASDVTDEYVDLELRLKNARALSAKLEELLKQAKEVKDALAVETELSRVRTEVERLEGRLNKLSNRIAYSTISAGFSETEYVPGRPEVNLPFWWLEELGLENLLSF